jgi:3',5'-cyclic AMP phosphodiesterase CpdA
MTKIAHLSDMHLVEENHVQRRRAHRLRLSWLSLLRPLEPEKRRHRAARALEAAFASGADHLVITGDLTEDGVPAQFEVLAGVLAESRWPASRVTLVPGNHDAYNDGGAFDQALEGPLRPYRETSRAGAVIAIAGALLVAVSTAFHQSFAKSAGGMERVGLDAIDSAAREASRRGTALVIAQHHPPKGHALPPIQWIDGFQQHRELTALLLQHDHAHVMHGHTHTLADRPVRSGASARIFSAEAVVDSASPLRLYKAEHGRLVPEQDASPLLCAEVAAAYS